MALLPDKPLLRALAGEHVSPCPVWLMRQAGRYLPEYRAIRAGCSSFLDLCYDPIKAAEVTLQPVRRFGMDAAILFSDILVIPDALGRDVAFKEGEGPVLTPISEARDVKNLQTSGALEHLAPVLETVRLVKSELPETVSLIGFAGAPWTLACYMVEGHGSKEFQHVRKMAYGERRLFTGLVDRLVETVATYLVAQIDAGAEALQIFDSWAGVLPEDEFMTWVIEPTRRLVTLVRKERPGIPFIGFPRGAGAMLPRYVEQTGVGCVSLDTTMPLDWAMAQIDRHVTLQGNLDPVVLLEGGDALAAAISCLLKAMRDRPFIFNLGHGVLPETKPKHVTDLVEQVRKGP